VLPAAQQYQCRSKLVLGLISYLFIIVVGYSIWPTAAFLIGAILNEYKVVRNSSAAKAG
jgi:hypothetical protein